MYAGRLGQMLERLLEAVAAPGPIEPAVTYQSLITPFQHG